MIDHKIQILEEPNRKDIFILKDDFVDIRESYFRELINSKSWYALPGGVQDSFSPFYEDFPIINLTQKEMCGYKIDSGGNLDYLKEKIKPLISTWENRSISIDEFSICPSVTFALHVCLMALKTMGIKIIAHETPAYFASVEQSIKHEFKSYLIPTSQERDFCITTDDIERLNNFNENFGLILTQPKIGTGLNRNKKELIELIGTIKDNSFLILDEAADRTNPSWSSEIIKDYSGIFRVKGIFKGLGLNAVKGAIIFHDKKYKSIISSIIEITGGAFDAFSVQILSKLSENTVFFKYALDHASNYVAKGVDILSKQLIGSNAQFRPLQNGYIGLIKIPIGETNFFEARTKLLEEAKKMKSPLVLGSSMYFPYDATSEWIRFNFFSSYENIERSAMVIDKLSCLF